MTWKAWCCSASLLVCLLLPAAPAGAGPRFVPLGERPWPGLAPGDSPFYDLERELLEEFRELCPEFFCQGLFDNYAPLRLQCAVEIASDTVSQCAFYVAASSHDVHPLTGALSATRSSWVCELPLPPGLGVQTWFDHMDVRPGRSGRLFNPWPGQQSSLFELLQECLP